MGSRNFTLATESDGGGDLTVTATKIQAVSVYRNVDDLVYFNDGAAFWSGNFCHAFQLTAQGHNTAPSWPIAGCWMLANTADDYKGILTASGDALVCYFAYNNTVGQYYLQLRESDGGTEYTSTIIYLPAEATKYYVVISRDESLGSFGRLTLSIYTDAAMTTHVSGSPQTLDLHTSKKDFQYLYGFTSFNDGNAVHWISGDIENLHDGLISITDTGAGADTQTAPILTVADTGAGADAITVSVLLTLTDYGTGIDSILIPEFFKQVTDAGYGTDDVSVSVVYNKVVTDSGSGVDSLLVTNLVTVTDTGTGVELASIVTPNIYPHYFSNVPAGQLANTQFHIQDLDGVVIQDWTSTGVYERSTSNGKAVYFFKWSYLGTGIISWKIDGTTYRGEETLDLYTTYIDLMMSRLDETISSRLAVADYTAPDNEGIDFVEKWVINRLVESPDGKTIALYDDDDVTPLKTWSWDPSTKTRSKGI